jgi:putative ABC transport system ATP-binding protein
MGPSGSGKSTLMNIIGCLDVPDSGGYWLNGADVTHMNVDELAGLRNRALGFVFQGFNLLARTSAVENVEVPLLYAGVGRVQRRARARELLERVGLGERFNHTPNQLSGGQQQRVALARALVNRPALLLADEPTGNLDSATSIEILNLLTELNQNEGVTVLMITHEPDIATRAQRKLMLRDGKLES